MLADIQSGSESVSVAKFHGPAERNCRRMNLSAIAQLGFASAIFIGAASSAKWWALNPTTGRILLTLLLYTAGNLLMLRLIRQVGMATAFSLSAVLQLVAVNLVAIAVFGERVGPIEGAGIVLAILAVALITLGPRLSL
jgi:glucose uptake protein GlcU